MDSSYFPEWLQIDFNYVNSESTFSISLTVILVETPDGFWRASFCADQNEAEIQLKFNEFLK